MPSSHDRQRLKYTHSTTNERRRRAWHLNAESVFLIRFAMKIFSTFSRLRFGSYRDAVKQLEVRCGGAKRDPDGRLTGRPAPRQLTPNTSNATLAHSLLLLPLQQFHHRFSHGFTDVHVDFGLATIVTVATAALSQRMCVNCSHVPLKLGILS